MRERETTNERKGEGERYDEQRGVHERENEGADARRATTTVATKIKQDKESHAQSEDPFDGPCPTAWQERREAVGEAGEAAVEAVAVAAEAKTVAAVGVADEAAGGAWEVEVDSDRTRSRTSRT